MIRATLLWMGLISLAFTTIPALGGIPAPPQSTVTVPAGTRVLIRMIDSVDSSKQQVGYRFTASLETNLQADNVVLARRGTPVYLPHWQEYTLGRWKSMKSCKLIYVLTHIDKCRTAALNLEKNSFPLKNHSSYQPIWQQFTS